MNEPEISSIFHETVLMLAYIIGIFVALYISRKNKIHPSLTFLLILICTSFYLLFSTLFITYFNSWYQELYSSFPHIDKSIGIIGVVLGLYISGILLSIPKNILYKFSLSFLVMYGISNLGCIAGHYPEIYNMITPWPADLESYSELYFGQLFYYNLLERQIELSILIRILGGILAIGFIYYYHDKFKNPKNLFMTTIFLIVLINFISQFFIHSEQILPVFDRLLGMTIFQWGFLFVNILIIMTVVANETANHKRGPRTKIKLPSGFVVFVVYIIIFIFAVSDYSFLPRSTPNIFIIGFILTTIFLVYYFYHKLQQSMLRYSTVLILILVGSLFLQARLFDQEKKYPDSTVIPKDQLKKDQSNFSDELKSTQISNKGNLQYIEFYHLGSESIKLSPISSFADNSLLKYSDIEQQAVSKN